MRFKYGAREVLHGLDLTIAPGEMIGLVGPNGAGKTTLLHILTGMLKPTTGQARVLGGAPRALRDPKSVRCSEDSTPRVIRISNEKRTPKVQEIIP